MKLVVTYDLPDERRDFEMAFHGADFQAVLRDLAHLLRQKIKYESDALSEDELETYRKLREWLFERLREDDLTLD